MKKRFRSRFKKHIIKFLEQKRALGYVYCEEERILKKFDSFCIDNYPSESTLTKSIALKWAEIGDNESTKTRNKRVSLTRELANYINSIGGDSYVIPSDLFLRETPYIPHLYAPEELSAIFSALDRLQPSHQSSIRHLVIPVMFRMIYCCGLRPKEGRKILRGNVDLKTGQIVIQESKSRKDRIVVLSADMLKLCQQYDKKIDAVLPEREYFFPKSDGNAYKHSGIVKTYRKCLEDTKVFFPDNRPRLYDLRHTFATNVLFRWMKEDKNMNAYLPYLSAYLGHEKFSCTAYYIHLVPQYFSQISDMCLSKNSHLIPEIENED